MEEWARDKVTPGFGKVSILHFVNCTSGFVFVQMVWTFNQLVLNLVHFDLLFLAPGCLRSRSNSLGGSHTAISYV